LFAILEPDLRRSIPAFSPPNAFSEVPTAYAVKNWNHVLFAHRIVQLIIGDRVVFGPLLTPEFASRLVHQLDTPVFEEREEVETALHLLLSDYVGFRRPMLRIMLAKLVAYLDGVRYLTLSIAPILRLLLTYFKTLSGPVKESTFLLFRHVFYPLFTQELADFYELAVTDLSAYFQSRDAATAFWCLRYLNNHWPCSCTHKQMMFFRQTAFLLPMLPMTALDRVGPVLLQTLRRCLACEHFQVSMNAAVFCAAPEFIDFLRYFPEDLSGSLMMGARVATAHWNSDTKELAETLVDSLHEFQLTSTPASSAPSPRNPPTTARFAWSDVVELAVAADDTLDLDHERSKLDEWLRKTGPGSTNS
jgi:hypothetical protein